MDENNYIGPAKISFTTFLLKILAGAIGGALGALILLLIFVFAGSVLSPLTTMGEDGYVSPVFVFILMVMIFLSSTISNILSVFFLSLTEREKYTRTSSAIYQVFTVSVVIFLLMVPIYFITAAVSASMTVYAVALHVIIAVQISALILEIVSNYKYALVGVYGVSFAILLSAGVMFALTGLGIAPAVLLFLGLPIAWTSLAFVQTVVTMLYGWIVRTYDKDFLSTENLYGADYGKQVESTKPEVPKAKDEAGGDFLRHN